jgi:hypothetical protein
MKKGKILMMTLLLFIVANKLSAQNYVNHTNIVFFKIGINNTGLLLGEPTEKAIQVFGKPTKIEDLFLELDDVKGKVLYYGDNQLIFSQNALISIKIIQPNMLIGKANGAQFKIGDKITTTTRQLEIDSLPPQRKTETIKSFNNFALSSEAGTFDNTPYKTSSTSYFKNADCSISLLFDANDSLVRVDVFQL